MHLYIIPTVLSLLYFSFYLSFHFVSVLDHSLSSSFVVIYRLLDAKVVLPGNTANTSPLLTINFQDPPKSNRLRFPEKFIDQLFALLPF